MYDYFILCSGRQLGIVRIKVPSFSAERGWPRIMLDLVCVILWHELDFKDIMQQSFGTYLSMKLCLFIYRLDQLGKSLTSSDSSVNASVEFSFATFVSCCEVVVCVVYVSLTLVCVMWFYRIVFSLIPFCFSLCVLVPVVASLSSGVFLSFFFHTHSFTHPPTHPHTYSRL